jgi:uncharacterized membrane protein YdjX (TVP38/TMEM64 family)
MTNYKTHAIGLVSFIIMLTIGFIFRNKLHHLKKHGILGIFLFTLIGNASILSPVGPVVTVLGGRLYPPWLVGFVAACGSILGEILTYNIGGIAEETNITEKQWYEKVKTFMGKNGFLTIIVITSIPNPLVNFAAVTAGSINYPLWKFLAASWMGNWVQFTICAALGSLTKKVRFLKKIN